MSYQEKYLKYKNKYLALKSQYGHLLKGSDNMPVNASKNDLLAELNASETEEVNNRINLINLVGGAKEEVVQASETETTVKNDGDSELSSLFGGAKQKRKSNKKNLGKYQHFFPENDDSELDSENSSVSEAGSDSDFESSDTDW